MIEKGLVLTRRWGFGALVFHVGQVSNAMQEECGWGGGVKLEKNILATATVVMMLNCAPCRAAVQLGIAAAGNVESLPLTCDLVRGSCGCGITQHSTMRRAIWACRSARLGLGRMRGGCAWH